MIFLHIRFFGSGLIGLCSRLDASGQFSFELTFILDKKITVYSMLATSQKLHIHSSAVELEVCFFHARQMGWPLEINVESAYCSRDWHMGLAWKLLRNQIWVFTNKISIYKKCFLCPDPNVVSHIANLFGFRANKFSVYLVYFSATIFHRTALFTFFLSYR
ncbi:hypothetical protein ACJX0J_035348 [Zea mays]